MDTNQSKKIVEEFEQKVRKNLISFLQKKEALDEHVPESVFTF